MAASPYSFTLNLIRMGFDMAESWFQLVTRFPEAAAKYLNLDWAKAWSGRGAAAVLEENQQLTFGQVLSFVPDTAIIGGREYDYMTLARNLSTLVQGPYDLNLIVNATKGPSQFYGTERWQLQIGDTYVSITNRLRDLLVRTYEVNDEGDLQFVTSYVVGA